jgi:hypothetical protein
MPLHVFRRVLATSLVVLAISQVLPASAETAEDCQRNFRPHSGQDGKDVVWVPTSDDTVSRMLTMAEVGPDDFVVDLGAGDGKIAIAAARDFGARSLGIEYNPDMVRLAQCNARVAGVGNRARIVQGDIFESDFRRATVVTLYLLPELNLRLRPTLLDMKPGTRVVSHDFTMDDWTPDASASDIADNVYLWIVPARVAGSWSFQPRRGGSPFVIELTQNFQLLNGALTANGVRRPLDRAVLRGSTIELTFADDAGQARRLSGTVDGDRIDATLADPDGGTIQYRGRRAN